MVRLVQLMVMGACVGAVAGLVSGHLALWPLMGMALGAAWSRLPEYGVPAST